jgi:hypothetical protein
MLISDGALLLRDWQVMEDLPFPRHLAVAPSKFQQTRPAAFMNSAGLLFCLASGRVYPPGENEQLNCLPYSDPVEFLQVRLILYWWHHSSIQPVCDLLLVLLKYGALASVPSVKYRLGFAPGSTTSPYLTDVIFSNASRNCERVGWLLNLSSQVFSPAFFISTGFPQTSLFQTHVLYLPNCSSSFDSSTQQNGDH